MASLPAFVNTEFGGHAIRLVCFVSSTTASELLHRTCVAVTAIVWLKCYAALYRKSRLTLISSITLWSPYTINCRANPLFLKTNARVNFKRTRGSLRSSSCLVRKPPRALQPEETHETAPSSRADRKSTEPRHLERMGASQGFP